ncbi:MAG: beta-lactamase family protein [Clostridia bacterium]|nr:beta-lactamase family protein [Clostridia bacterium]
MTNFEALTALLEKNAPGAYMAAEMTENSYQEKYFRLGAGAHNTYSLSKSVTSCAVGILEHEGKLRDTDTVYSHIPDLFPAGYDKKWETVTLADVMHHKTGYGPEANIDIDAMDFWADGHEDFIGHILSLPIIYEPGKGPFVYCDTNYYLIGIVVERVTGMTLYEFLQLRMFNKLKWRGHAWGACPQNHTLGGTGLFACIRDLCSYGLMLSCGGVYDGQQILTPEWIEKARGEIGSYGYGFTNSPDGRWFFTGGAYGQAVYIFPETKRSFSVLGHDMPIGMINTQIVPLYLD